MTIFHPSVFPTFLKNEGLPPTFPAHADSLRAEIFSRKVSQLPTWTFSLPVLLNYFRLINNSYYGNDPNLVEAPAKYAYAMAYHPKVAPHFGVTAPLARCSGSWAEGKLVREYRRGTYNLPPSALRKHEEAWAHGHCAESQALPAVVARCEKLGLTQVVIESRAIGKSGRAAKLCNNCRQYARCVLAKHPYWVIVDGSCGERIY